MTREQFVITRLSEWSTRNAWAAEVAKTKLREFEAKTSRDIVRRKGPQADRRSS